MKKGVIAYASGPGDVVNTFRCWSVRQDDHHQVAQTYSGQFFSVCQRLGLKGVVLGANPRADFIQTQQFEVAHLPKPEWKGAWDYHFHQAKYMVEVARAAIEKGARVLVVACSTGHWFPLRAFAGKLHIIPSFHCTLWPSQLARSRSSRLIQRLNRPVYSKVASGILCLSGAIHDQLKCIVPEGLAPIYPFIPTYDEGSFQGGSEPGPKSSFRLLFAGRLEEDKGVFDLLDIAAQLGDGYHVAICGDGSQEEALRHRVVQMGLQNRVTIHGYCRKERMLELMGDSHAVIVPTRPEFDEGFNKVIAEAALLQRPVITSRVCPALEVVGPGAVEVEPGDVSGYVDAVRSLREIPWFYEEKRRGCLSCRAPFFDETRSWGAALERALGAI